MKTVETLEVSMRQEKEMEGRIFTMVFPTLKGGGQITEWESKMAMAAYSMALDPGLSHRERVKAARIAQYEIKRLFNVKAERIGQKAPYPKIKAPPGYDGFEVTEEIEAKYRPKWDSYEAKNKAAKSKKVSTGGTLEFQ